MFSESCFLAGTLSGTVSGNSWTGSLSGVPSGSASFSGTISGGTINGTYTLVSGVGCVVGDTGTFTLTFVPNPINVSGQWSGAWLSGGVVGLIAASLSQSGTTMWGTVGFTGSPCFASGTISGTEIANVWDGGWIVQIRRALVALGGATKRAVLAHEGVFPALD